MNEPRSGPGVQAAARPDPAAKNPATKLAAARARLILDRPFLGALVMRLPAIEAGAWCRTSATDMKNLYYSRAYIERLSLSQVEFLLAHEALHCALAHFVRRGHRVQHKWDLACDFAINTILAGDGLKPPPEAIVLSQFENMTAEEIYRCLDDDLDSETLDQHLYDNADYGSQSGESNEPPPDEAQQQEQLQSQKGAGATPEQTESGGSGTQAAQTQAGDEALAAAPPPLAEQEREELAQKWRQHLAGAAQQAERAGKLGGAVARMVDGWLAPKLPWRALLADYVVDRARNEFSYMRASRREGEMILPSLRGAHCDLVLALDTSGSIATHELEEFAAEINAIKGALQARITLLACDARLADGGPWIFEPWEPVCLPATLHGGGGTDFAPVFDWVEDAGLRPDALVYFTDAEAAFPPVPPPYPVIWLIKGGQPVPWGQRIQLN